MSSAIQIVSDAQFAANRANAQLSTGPRTEEGKAVSRRNGWKHGLTGQTLVLSDEEREAYENFRAAIFENLLPANALENELANAIVMDRWRLNRVQAIENNIFAMGETDEETFLSHAKQLNLLTLYEGRISRNAERTLKQLKQLQAERRALDERREAERRRELTDAALICQLREMKGLPFDPRKDGFAFSAPEIHHEVLRQQAAAARKELGKRAA